ncbi:hypothetical protein [Aquimarina algiphila]|uniref:hypothetical protein n=1 Tax=Aquimarina algiphila TaxID=2047982 RepID=UPI00232AFBFD|nr:hypothetical protein [Aquimarina algiphila]
MRDYTYLMEKYSLLIYGLTIGKGNIKERLFENSQHLHSTFSLEFPEDFHSQKYEIITRLTKFPALFSNNEIIYSSYDRTILKCKHKTLEELTKLIANLYIDIQFYLRKYRIKQ